MADQELKILVAQGLQALKAGSDVAKYATSEIQDDASHPDLKSALQAGNKTAEQWAQRITQALRETCRPNLSPGQSSLLDHVASETPHGLDLAREPRVGLSLGQFDGPNRLLQQH